MVVTQPRSSTLADAVTSMLNAAAHASDGIDREDNFKGPY